MYCQHCGQMIPDNSKFCDNCGAPQDPSRKPAAPMQEVQPNNPYQQPAYYPTGTSTPSVSPIDAITSYFRNYATFSGRARRSEYWWAVLFVSVVTSILQRFVPSVVNIWSLATLVPSLALAVRRLHDVGKRGTYYLWILLPIVGWIMLIIRFCTDSIPGPNEFGPSPKYQ